MYLNTLQAQSHLFAIPRFYETMERKQEQSTSYGDGEAWLRGPMIAKGSFGTVYLSYLKEPNFQNSGLPPVMAVKSADVSVSYSLHMEKKVLDNLKGCSYILNCFGEETTIRSNGQVEYNLLLEYASGGDLSSLIYKSKDCRLPESEVRRHTRSKLRGLKYIHDSNYVHCDLKPENILLVPTTTSESDSKFVAKIGDFGLSKWEKESRLDLNLRGTRMYMSPEVVTDGVQGRPSDIWALGCVVLEMLTGNQPWDEVIDDDDLLPRIASEGAVPNIPDEISEDVKSFLKGCFEREPESRPTAEMLLNHPFVAGLDEDVDKEMDECEAASILVLVLFDKVVKEEYHWIQRGCTKFF